MALADLVPPGVVVVAGRTDDPRWPDLVPPAEDALVAERTAVRRTEFVAGRACARLALAGLGLGPVDVIGVADDRAPRWPDGVVGSISHGAGEVAAAVAWRTTLAGLGVDVEVAQPLDAGVIDVVTTPVERDAAWDCGLGPLGPVVLLAAAEALFKAWAPTRGWLEPEQVRVLLAPDGTLTATVLATGAVLPGAWEVDGAVVRAAAWLA